MADSYEVVERLAQAQPTMSPSTDDGSRSLRSQPATPKSPATSSAQRSSSRGTRERTVSPASSQRQSQQSANSTLSASATQSSPSTSQGKPAAPSSQRIANLIQRQYIYFTTLLQEPEPKWKPVTDSRGVTVSQLDSIDRNLVVYRAEATFVGVAVWDLFAAISTPGVRKAWEPNADDDRLLEEVRLPELDAGNELGSSLSRNNGGSSGPVQVGNNSRSGLSRRTANGPPSQLWHLKQRAAWPVAARDAVLLSTTYRSQDCSSVHHFSFSTSDRGLFPTIPPATQGTIRSQVDLRGWSIEALNPTTAHVTLIEQSDPKGWTTKSSSIPNAMVSAVAGVGAWAIKCGGPPIVTHLSIGAKQVVAKYESDKGRYRLEYELDRSLRSEVGEDGDAKARTSFPPVIECELRCDLDLWSPNLDLIIDPPPIHVAVLRRAKLSRNGAGGGLWLTIEHASASLGALNSADDDDEDGMADDVARITVRKGDGITSETGVVLINGARMTVEVEELDEEATKATLSRSQRSKPKRAPLDTVRQPASAGAVLEPSGTAIKLSSSPTTMSTLSAPLMAEGSSSSSRGSVGAAARVEADPKISIDLGEDISQALADQVTEAGSTAATAIPVPSTTPEASAVAGDQASASSIGSKEEATSTSPTLTSGPAPAVPATISRSGSPAVRPTRSTSVREDKSGGVLEHAKAIAVPGRSSPRLSDRPHGTLRERDRNRERDWDPHSTLPAGSGSGATTSALSTSFSASSPMMNVLSRINAGSTATSSITNTQASGQLRIASGVEPPSRSPTIESNMSRTGSGEGGRSGNGVSSAQDGGSANDKDKRVANVTGKTNDTMTSKSGSAGMAATNSNSGASVGASSQASTSTSTAAAQISAGWKWLTKSFGAPPVPRDSTSAAAAVLAEDEKRKQERDKAAARAAAKAAAKAKKGKPSTTDAANPSGGAAGGTAAQAGSGEAGAGESISTIAGDTSTVGTAAAAAKQTADAAMAAASTAAANAQTGVIALRNRMATMQFSLPTLVLTAVIAFLFGSLVRALLSPADFVLLPHSPYDILERPENILSSPGTGERSVRTSQPRISGSSADSGSGVESHLSRLLQDVLGTFSPSHDGGANVGSTSQRGSAQVQRNYGQDEMERLLLKALQAGVSAGGEMQEQRNQHHSHHQHAAVRNVSWREIKRLIEIKGLMAGWDLVIAVVRR